MHSWLHASAREHVEAAERQGEQLSNSVTELPSRLERQHERLRILFDDAMHVYKQGQAAAQTQKNQTQGLPVGCLAGQAGCSQVTHRKNARCARLYKSACAMLGDLMDLCARTVNLADVEVARSGPTRATAVIMERLVAQFLARGFVFTHLRPQVRGTDRHRDAHGTDPKLYSLWYLDVSVRMG